jgi:glucokinase
MGKIVYGIDVGGTSIKFGLFNSEGVRLITKFEKDTPKTNQQTSVLECIFNTIQETNQLYGYSELDIEGIGLAVPCPVKDGIVNSCANVKWENMNIKKELAAKFSNQVHVVVSNDANIAAYGENASLEIPFRNAIVITLGTGVGSGIILNGEILEGSTGMGGEIGHTHVYDGPIETCGCGAKGCLEQMCASKGMTNYALELSEEMSTSINLNQITIKDIFEAAKLGDKLCLKVVDRAAEYLGKAASVVALTIDPDAFIIGGGISKAGQYFLDKIKNAYQKYARFSTGNKPFLLAKTGNDAGIIGAAHYAIKK